MGEFDKFTLVPVSRRHLVWVLLVRMDDLSDSEANDFVARCKENLSNIRTERPALVPEQLEAVNEILKMPTEAYTADEEDEAIKQETLDAPRVVTAAAAKALTDAGCDLRPVTGPVFPVGMSMGEDGLECTDVHAVQKQLFSEMEEMVKFAVALGEPIYFYMAILCHEGGSKGAVGSVVVRWWYASMGAF